MVVRNTRRNQTTKPCSLNTVATVTHGTLDHRHRSPADVCMQICWRHDDVTSLSTAHVWLPGSVYFRFGIANLLFTAGRQIQTETLLSYWPIGEQWPHRCHKIQSLITDEQRRTVKQFISDKQYRPIRNIRRTAMKSPPFFRVKN